MNNFQMPYSYQSRYPITNNGITWVQGVEGAKAFQLAPNSNVQLMDSENDNIFYIKVSDNVGMCTLRTFKYEEITNAPTTNTDYVTHDELAKAIAELKGVIENAKQPVSAIDAQKSVILK